MYHDLRRTRLSSFDSPLHRHLDISDDPELQGVARLPSIISIVSLDLKWTTVQTNMIEFHRNVAIFLKGLVVGPSTIH